LNLAGKDVFENMLSLTSVKGRDSIEKFEQDAANRPPIASLVLLIAFDGFRGQIVGSAYKTSVCILRVKQGHWWRHHIGKW
jgi:hypothetical protein